MQLRNMIIAAGLLLALSHPLRGQVGFSLPVLNNVTTGQLIQIPIEVTNFDSIASIQFVIEWDPAVLTYLNVINYGLPDMDPNNFNGNVNGELRFLWEGPILGTDLPDGSTIFTMFMRVDGPVNSGTAVSFTERPPTTFFEVTRTNGEILTFNDVGLENGFVAVGYAVSAFEPQAQTLPVQVYPNPIQYGSKVYFELDQAELVEMEYIGVDGRVLFKQAHSLHPGEHGIVIDYMQVQQLTIPSYLLLRAGKKHAFVPLMGF